MATLKAIGTFVNDYKPRIIVTTVPQVTIINSNIISQNPHNCDVKSGIQARVFIGGRKVLSPNHRYCFSKIFFETLTEKGQPTGYRMQELNLDPQTIILRVPC